MIVIAWNFAAMLYGVREGLVPAGAMLPQFIVAGATFAYYGVCFDLPCHRGGRRKQKERRR
jgi:hypothetical protein